MITEIIIRHYLPEMAERARQMAEIVRRETDMIVREIDHTGMSLDDFDIPTGRVPITIDRHMGEKFGIPYVRVSRMFDLDGAIKARKLIIPEILPENICIIDTDVVSGRTMQRACAALGTESWRTALTIAPHQDLIDVEDLVYPLSLLSNGRPCSYLINERFFARRTSLPEHLYRPLSLLLG